MPMLATLTFACLCALPQDGAGAAQGPLLSSAEQKSLRDKLAKLVEARNAYDEATDRQREKAGNAYAKAKEAFHKEWDSRVDKKGDLMRSVVDLQAIFENIFSYPSKSASSIRKIDAKDGIPAYSVSIPKNYKPQLPTRTVLLLAGHGDKGWVEGRDYFGQTWDKAACVADTIFHVPALPADLDLDPIPDYSKTGAEGDEARRIGEALRSFGETQRTYNVDRRRLFLDAGKDASGFALRIASHFPDRFAGLILRHPVAVDGIRLGSLTGVPVLLLRSAETATACNNLEQRLNKLAAGQCTVIDARGAYPFAESAAEIETWMGGVQRDVNRTKVVLEPNDDRFRKGYWVAMDNMDTIHTSPADKKPRIEVEADRAANRITIQAVGIESVELLLNDALLDLDKEFTVVVNNKAITERRTRDFNRMLEYAIQRFDADFLFPVLFRVRVPTDTFPGVKNDGQSVSR